MADPALFPEVTLRVEGVDELVVGFKTFVKRASAKTRRVTVTYGRRLQADVRARARSMFDITDYDESIQMRMAGTENRPRAVVYSDAPQAHRLEYGFIGTDSAGRHVEQAPRPHFRPALAAIHADYVRAMAEALKQ